MKKHEEKTKETRKEVIMTVELTIQHLFDICPELFKERADCLNQLFCTIGNGYEWKYGELVPVKDVPEDKKKLKKHLVNGKAHQHKKLSLRATSLSYLSLGYFDEFMKAHNVTVEEMIERINKKPDDVYHEKPRAKRWGFCVDIPGHEKIDYHKDTAFLFNTPQDIKPDWAKAIAECKAMLREDGYDV